MSDPISNMLISIKNGSISGKPTVFVPYSNLKNNIALCLKKEGYIASVTKKAKKGHPYLELGLIYEEKKPKVRNVVRMSKQSRRYYVGVKDIHSVLGGHGVMVLSTPKGIMSGRDARREHVGGEALFKDLVVRKFAIKIMSRIGKKEISVPSGVTLKQDGMLVTVTGPKGSLTREFRDDINLAITSASVTLTPKRNDKFSKALWGTYASHIKNMMQGVVTPYQKKLILEGVGFKSEVKGKELHLALGFSHPVVVKIPEDITMTAEKNNLTITSIDKESVGRFTAEVRSLKKPEPYKGKGMRYDSEVIRRKQGKKTA